MVTTSLRDCRRVANLGGNYGLDQPQGRVQKVNPLVLHLPASATTSRASDSNLVRHISYGHVTDLHILNQP